ncbi:MAG: hypothetical protein HYW01_00170 [Deltaproteobacteria bacterium]|nr:hypothetical protein [Deltaproteobacteria bacterium]
MILQFIGFLVNLHVKGSPFLSRTKLPACAEIHVLLMSRRRCCICFGLHGDTDIKRGQIAHLDGNPENNSVENLAFMCLVHHDEYDGNTRQSKGLTIREIKHYRVELYEFLQGSFRPGAASSTESPWSNLWPPGKWTVEHDEALEFYTGTHRSQSVVFAVSQGPITLEDINACIPPHDVDWTESIVSDLVKRGWIQVTSSEPGRYELSTQGYQMLRALMEIPENIKDAVWRRVWLGEGEDEDGDLP